ncbi:hypothetical protein PIIN_09761 [Serendipita indica DSM 11827]|uniref:Uncharacterized protein n=1 Tax=Serendipita indica (strain DSM 11827) TaxID=1109443 RepID=G4TWS8_SERID|nr:hypothetical protein PIIN_09761 [Serendipita indica DSM 11827]
MTLELYLRRHASGRTNESTKQFSVRACHSNSRRPSSEDVVACSALQFVIDLAVESPRLRNKYRSSRPHNLSFPNTDSASKPWIIQTPQAYFTLWKTFENDWPQSKLGNSKSCQRHQDGGLAFFSLWGILMCARISHRRVRSKRESGTRIAYQPLTKANTYVGSTSQFIPRRFPSRMVGQANDSRTSVGSSPCLNRDAVVVSDRCSDGECGSEWGKPCPLCCSYSQYTSEGGVGTRSEPSAELGST